MGIARLDKSFLRPVKIKVRPELTKIGFDQIAGPRLPTPGLPGAFSRQEALRLLDEGDDLAKRRPSAKSARVDRNRRLPGPFGKSPQS